MCIYAHTDRHTKHKTHNCKHTFIHTGVLKPHELYRRAEYLQDNPGTSTTEVQQQLEGEWRNMTEEEQAPYHAGAKVCV